MTRAAKSNDVVYVHPQIRVVGPGHQMVSVKTPLPLLWCSTAGTQEAVSLKAPRQKVPPLTRSVKTLSLRRHSTAPTRVSGTRLPTDSRLGLAPSGDTELVHELDDGRRAHTALVSYLLRRFARRLVRVAKPLFALVGRLLPVVTRAVRMPSRMLAVPRNRCSAPALANWIHHVNIPTEPGSCR